MTVRSPEIDLIWQGKRELCGGAISLPESASRRDYVELIRRLADDDSPRMFGLPVNITASWQRSEAARVIAQLRHLQAGDSHSDKFDRDAWSAALTPVLNLWKKLNQGSSLHTLNLAEVRKDADANPDSPLVSFLSAEWVGGVELIQSVHASLASLSRAIRGTAALTAATKRLAAALLRNETPGDWQSVWEGPEDPVAYLPALVSRAAAQKDWLRRAHADTLRSDALDLAQLFHPDTFLNALRQQTARELATGMDQLKLVASWKDDLKGGVKMTGLMVEGATFDGSSLRETAFNSPPEASVPPVCVAWLPKDSQDAYSADESVWVPVYFSSERERVVVSLRVPCAKTDANKWLIAAVAFFLRS